MATEDTERHDHLKDSAGEPNGKEGATPSTVVDLLANTPLKSIEATNVEEFMRGTFDNNAPKQPYIGEVTGDIDPNDPDFTTHTTHTAPPPPNMPNAPKQGVEEGPAGVPENRRNRIWRNAGRAVQAVDRGMSQLNGWLNERDPKEFRADASDIKMMMETAYDAMQEWAIEMKEEVSVVLVFFTVYGFDTIGGIGHRVSKWMQKRKAMKAMKAQAAGRAERNAGARSVTDETTIAEKRPETAPNAGPAHVEDVVEVRICKLPSCNTPLRGRKQPHFCCQEHATKYNGLLTLKKVPDHRTFERSMDKDGTIVSTPNSEK